MQYSKIKKLLEFKISKNIISSSKYFIIENANEKKNLKFNNKRILNKVFFNLNCDFGNLNILNLKFKLSFKKFKLLNSLIYFYENNNKHINIYPVIINVNFLLLKNGFDFYFYIFVWNIVFSKIKNLSFNKLLFYNNLNA